MQLSGRPGTGKQVPPQAPTDIKVQGAGGSQVPPQATADIQGQGAGGRGLEPLHEGVGGRGQEPWHEGEKSMIMSSNNDDDE